MYTADGSNLPLIVVLHGGGEIGSDLGKLKKREPYLSLKSGKCAPEAVVLMPQFGQAIQHPGEYSWLCPTASSDIQ